MVIFNSYVKLPEGKTYKKPWEITIEIVDVPINNGWIFPSFVCMLTRPGQWLEVGETWWLHHLRFFLRRTNLRLQRAEAGLWHQRAELEEAQVMPGISWGTFVV
jgi:hypothetical protein